MPIYEYQALNLKSACHKCRDIFEFFQGIHEKPLSSCPYCGKRVKKMISWSYAAVIETSDEHMRAERKIKEYEKSGMWSHAAELADKHSEKTKDKDLKIRALENYKKAGYDADSLARNVREKGRDR